MLILFQKLQVFTFWVKLNINIKKQNWRPIEWFELIYKNVWQTDYAIEETKAALQIKI